MSLNMNEPRRKFQYRYDFYDDDHLLVVEDSPTDVLLPSKYQNLIGYSLQLVVPKDSVSGTEFYNMIYNFGTEEEFKKYKSLIATMGIQVVHFAKRFKGLKMPYVFVDTDYFRREYEKFSYLRLKEDDISQEEYNKKTLALVKKLMASLEKANAYNEKTRAYYNLPEKDPNVPDRNKNTNIGKKNK